LVNPATAMTTKAINVDLTEVREEKDRNAVKSILKEQGIVFHEVTSFWSSFEKGESDASDNTIVIFDLQSIANHLKDLSHVNWAFKVIKKNPYFISFIRGSNDRKLISLINELFKHSYSRFALIQADECFSKEDQADKFIRELKNIILRNYNQDSIKSVNLNKSNQSFSVEFNDGKYGEVSFEDLHLEDVINQLLLDSVRLSDRGDSIEMFTRDGDIFDIDADLLKSFISSDTKEDIRRQTELTADTVGNRLRMVRMKRHMTQKELSELTAIDQAILSKIETGKHLPRFDTLERIAKGLGLTVSELLNNDYF